MNTSFLLTHTKFSQISSQKDIDVYVESYFPSDKKCQRESITAFILFSFTRLSFFPLHSLRYFDLNITLVNARNNFNF